LIVEEDLLIGLFDTAELDNALSEVNTFPTTLRDDKERFFVADTGFLVGVFIWCASSDDIL
jgi:hypothetical protein